MINWQYELHLSKNINKEVKCMSKQKTIKQKNTIFQWSKRNIKKAIAHLLAFAMVLSSITWVNTVGGGITAKAAEIAVYTDNMEAEASGWTIEWSDENIEHTAERKKNEWQTNNATNFWNIWSKNVQTVTISKTCDNLQEGNYKLSVSYDGEKISSATVSISNNTDTKIKEFNPEKFNVWHTVETDVLALSKETDIKIEFSITFQDDGYLDCQNQIIVLRVGVFLKKH